MFDPTPILTGDRRALARLLTRLENAEPDSAEALTALFPHTGRAHIIGVTGAPGCGKSGLVSALAKTLRRAGQTVAIIAVDPSSPFTGGALLGDRVRMAELAGDPGVFIRSMASRGALGGLARATADIISALDAAGYNKILVETVGAGQVEVEIAGAAQTVVVVEAPGLGDEVQALKAGILEIADVLVMNKADQPEAESAVRALRAALELRPPTTWIPPLIQTIATEGRGAAELATAVEQHRAHLQASGDQPQRERARLKRELLGHLREQWLEQWLAQTGAAPLEAALDQLQARALDPRHAAQILLEPKP